MAEMTESGMKFSFDGEIDSDSSIAYFPGCIDLFDKFLDLERTKFHPIGQSAINLMNKAGIKPNVISLKCCGHDDIGLVIQNPTIRFVTIIPS